MPEMHDKTAKAPRTEAQKEAARRNGAKSRGPVTPMGKAICARNALRHGLTAFHLALSSEDHDSFNRVLADYMDEYRPVDVTETNLVEQIAFAQWQLYRAWTAETAALNIEIETNRAALDERFTHYAEPVHVAAAIESSLARTGSLPHLHRCQTRINRDYFRALTMLRSIRKACTSHRRIAETVPAILLETQENAPLETAQNERQPSVNPGEPKLPTADPNNQEHSAPKTGQPEAQPTQSDNRASRTTVEALSSIVFAAAALLTLALSIAQAQQPQTPPTAWTVFQGSEAEAVPIEIIGVWKNVWGPKQDIILGGHSYKVGVCLSKRERIAGRRDWQRGIRCVDCRPIKFGGAIAGFPSHGRSSRDRGCPVAGAPASENTGADVAIGSHFRTKEPDQLCLTTTQPIRLIHPVQTDSDNYLALNSARTSASVRARW